MFLAHRSRRAYVNQVLGEFRILQTYSEIRPLGFNKLRISLNLQYQEGRGGVKVGFIQAALDLWLVLI